jgi:glycosyltransferase involved in cell wall biosynthesis
MKKNKVLFVLANPFTNDSRVLKEATSLTKMGFNVTIFCKYAKGLKRREVVDNITIKRFGSDFFFKTRILRRVYINIFWLFGLIESFKNYQIIHCHDWDTLLVGAFAKIFSFGAKKLVYDSHEYASEQWVGKRFYKKIVQAIEYSFITLADRVINVSNGIAEEYKRIYKIKKPDLILNCPPYKDVGNYDLFREKFGISKEAIIFLYQGGLTGARNIELILNSFKKLNDPNKVIVFLGYGNMVEKIEEASKSYNNIFYHPAVTPNELYKYTKSADLGIALLFNDCLNNYYCLPNKFFEYSMAGLPVIISNLYEIAKLQKEFDNGFILNEDNEESFYEIIATIKKENLSNKQVNSKRIAKQYNWEAQEAVLFNIYKSLGNFPISIGTS